MAKVVWGGGDIINRAPRGERKKDISSFFRDLLCVNDARAARRLLGQTLLHQCSLSR